MRMGYRGRVRRALGLLDLRTALLGWSSLLLVAAADGLAAVVCVRWSRCEDGGVALASLVSVGEGIWLLNLQRGRLVRVVCAAERGGSFACSEEGRGRGSKKEK